MKKIVLAAAVAIFTTPAFAASTIPTQFQGNWASAADCKQAKNAQDTEAAMSIVRIDATSVSYGEAQCSLARISIADAS